MVEVRQDWILGLFLKVKSTGFPQGLDVTGRVKLQFIQNKCARPRILQTEVRRNNTGPTLTFPLLSTFGWKKYTRTLLSLN